MNKKEIIKEKTKVSIAKKYVQLGTKLKRLPTHSELTQAGIDRNRIRHYFGDKEGLEDYLEKTLPREFSKLLKLADSIEKEKAVVYAKILRRYVNLASKNGVHPTFKDMEYVGISKQAINQNFGSLHDLKALADLEYPETMSLVFDEDALLSEDRILATEENLKKFPRIVVSSIGTGECDKKYLASMLKYCSLNNSRVMLLCTEMNFSMIDPYIKHMYMENELDIVFRQAKFHQHMHLNPVMIDEKVVNPTAGMGRYKIDESSFIFASPKQTLDPVPTKMGKYPRFKMSPGAITKPDYFKGMSKLRGNLGFKRTKRRMMAENDHLMGAIILEKDGEYFHFRQTQRMNNGGFWDFFVSYTENEVKPEIPDGLIWGDLHSKKKSKYNFRLNVLFLKLFGISKTVVHDIYDSASQNPHEKDNIINNMVSFLTEEESTPDEIQVLVNDLTEIRGATKETYIVDSNHNDMFKRSFNNNMIWKGSKQNAFLGTLLYPMAVMDDLRDTHTEKELTDIVKKRLGVDMSFLTEAYPLLFKKSYLLQYACNLYGLKNGDDLIWGNLESSYKIGEFECADHGHKGVHGSKGSIGQFLNSFEKIIFGHTHTERQHNFVLSVGHTTNPADQRYAKGGMSGWTISRALISNGGQFQSVRTINGRFRSFKDAYTPPELEFAFKKLDKYQQTYKGEHLEGVA